MYIYIDLSLPKIIFECLILHVNVMSFTSKTDSGSGIVWMLQLFGSNRKACQNNRNSFVSLIKDGHGIEVNLPIGKALFPDIFIELE